MVKDKKTKKSSSGFVDRLKKSRKMQLAIVLPILAIVIVYGVVSLGGFLQFPSPPPEELATGYARIYLIDGYSGNQVPSNDINLIFYANRTLWDDNMNTGTTFYVPDASVWWVNVSGYYPVGNTLLASGGNDPADYYNNTMNIFKRADPDDIFVELYRWKNLTSGLYNYSGYLPDYDGSFELEIKISINMPSRNISMFGYAGWIPNYTLSENSFAQNLSLSFCTLWFGWNGIVDGYLLTNNIYWDFNDVYDINILNCTMLPGCFYDATYLIRGNFSNLQSVQIYDGIIDNYDNYIAMIT